MEKVREWISFTRHELNGLVVLFILIAGILAFPAFYSYFRPEQVFSAEKFKTEIDRFNASAKTNDRVYHDRTGSTSLQKPRIQYFPFNPNGLDEASWIRLGLNERQVRVIKNFESKGGHFYKKEDLRKIYSIAPATYDKLEPYIHIPPRVGEERLPFKKTEKYTRIPEVVVLVELNGADSTLLESVRGIGPAFASRIIRYRDRLGGFYRKEQLLEIFGMDSSKYAQLQGRLEVDPSSIQKIRINTVDFDGLKRCPYLSYKQMNAIIQYRKQHGDYHSANDLSAVQLLTDEVIRKLIPYLAF